MKIIDLKFKIIAIFTILDSMGLLEEIKIDIKYHIDDFNYSFNLGKNDWHNKYYTNLLYAHKDRIIEVRDEKCLEEVYKELKKQFTMIDEKTITQDLLKVMILNK